MYNSDRRYHLLLGQPEAPARPAVHAEPAPPSGRRTATLLSILKALSWMGEIRTLPFGGLSSHYDERPKTRY